MSWGNCTEEERSHPCSYVILGPLLLATLLIGATSRPPPGPEPNRPAVTYTTSGPQKSEIYPSQPESPGRKHPRHMVKVWLTTHKGRTFRVIQLPRCEHMEAVIAHNPAGETKEEAKERLGGVAVCTGSFHNSRTMALADFLQKDGSILSGARTGRWFLAVQENGDVDISNNYMLVKGKSGVSAVALGQRLVPLQYDGFSTAFMNRATDRMALGLSHDYIFIVQGRSDIWRLAHFMEHVLPCRIAINADGGHVVRGKAPVHIVFRWRQEPAYDTASPEQ